jgi:hypothetical protein
MRRLGAAALAAALLASTIGCAPTLLSETGLVTSVDGSSLVAIDGFQLRTADGRTLEFSTRDLPYRDDGFPPQHLREHQALAEPITVTYRITDGRNDVVKLQDAAAP